MDGNGGPDDPFRSAIEPRKGRAFRSPGLLWPVWPALPVWLHPWRPVSDPRCHGSGLSPLITYAVHEYPDKPDTECTAYVICHPGS